MAICHLPPIHQLRKLIHAEAMSLGKALDRLAEDRSLASLHVHQDRPESFPLQSRPLVSAAPSANGVPQSTGQALRVVIVESILVREGSDALGLNDLVLG